MADQTEQERKEVDLIMRRWNAMKRDRMNWESHWDELSKYVIPKKDNIYGQNIKGGGEKKNQFIYDGTAIHSNELLASALHAMLTNPTTFWFEVTTGDPELDKQDKIRGWLQRATLQMHNVLNNSNFQTEVHETYLDLGSFGTAPMRIQEDDEMVVRFHARPIYEHWIAENNKQIVDVVYRKFKWELRQIMQEFGLENLPDDLQQMLKTDDKAAFKEFEILHCVHPKDEKSKKFEGVYILLKGRRILAKENFNEFPYVVPRWTKISSETYGRSPAMKSLPDIKMLNMIMKTTIRAAQKSTDPALQMPDEGMSLPIRTMPGGINYYRAGTPDRIMPIETGSRPDIGFEVANDIRERIRSAFFIDQLQLSEGPQMTATEVVQRTEEKLRLMGPILGRQLFEFSRPMLNRTFNIMARKNKFDEAPPELAGKDITFQYTSQIVRAQRLSDSQNLLRAIETVGPIIQADPGAFDVINTDKTVVHALKVHGIPQELLRGEQEVAEIRQQKAEAAQAAQQNQQELDNAEKVQKAAPSALQAQQQ